MTKNSLLRQNDKNNLPNDELYNERKIECRKAFDEIKYQHYGKLSVRMGELAAIGHLNIEDAKSYAEAVITFYFEFSNCFLARLYPFLQERKFLILLNLPGLANKEVVFFQHHLFHDIGKTQTKCDFLQAFYLHCQSQKRIKWSLDFLLFELLPTK